MFVSLFRFLLVLVAVVLSCVSACSAVVTNKHHPRWGGQLKFDDTAAAKKIASAEHLRELVLENANRKAGSLRYARSWRHWSQLSIDTIRYRLSQSLPVTADSQGFSDLWFALGVAADQGEMPSFECAGSRSGYALDFFCRARLLADLLLDFQDNPTLPANWKNDTSSSISFRNPLQRQSNKTCRLLSLGGGPGYDYVAAALVASFHAAAIPTETIVVVEATILDYEEGWHDLVDAMAAATADTMPASRHTCRWGGKCDITKPLSDPSNAACLAEVETTDLFVCQYCIAENANLLRDGELCFFVELFQRAPGGALFVFTETTPRVWPAFVDLLESRPELNDVQIGFVRNIGRGKSGPQMVLRKVLRHSSGGWGDSIMSPEQVVLCDGFRRKRAMHERKMKKNWKRQTKKVRGAK